MGDFMLSKLLGEKIKTFRLKRGLSQEKFALLIGMDRTYIASVEKGKRNISLNSLYKISNGLNITLSELFDGIPILKEVETDAKPNT